ncbi:MAG: calcium/sodium antiporter [Lachnospiraceae bacterium]|nr:calcium/sodium antiporter [Lachnospiraceae bacterium]
MENFINSAPIFLVVLLLAVGFVLLIKGADVFVDGSSSIAKRFHVPSLIIGLTIVSMGTSLPETAVSITASIGGSNSLAISNAIGSNLFNLMVVIGVCAIMATVPVGQETIRGDIPFSAVCAGVLMLLGILGIADVSGMTLGHLDGVLLLLLFAGYLAFLFRRTMKASKDHRMIPADAEVAEETEENYKVLPLSKSLLFIAIGIVGIAVGGDLTVDTASRIAMELGMSETLVGLTIVSIGTSLPELVTSVMAARKNEVGMALGNAIGSNIFNILMVLGIASAISPIALITENIIDIVVLLVFTLIVWIFAATKKKLNKTEGVIMLLLYVVYAVYICIR